jgi:uncharacterized SAM-binding protein YcdF (DUF218 family)
VNALRSYQVLCLGAVILSLSVGALGHSSVLNLVGEFLLVTTEISTSDLVIPLGGGTGERVDKASQLYRDGLARKVVLPGAIGVGSGGRYWTDAIMKQLLDEGVLQSDIIWELTAKNTFEEAAGLKALMIQKHYASAIVVTDPPHLRRAAYIFTKVFTGSGLKLEFCPSGSGAYPLKEWWKEETTFFYVINEYQKLLYYFLKY